MTTPPRAPDPVTPLLPCPFCGSPGELRKADPHPKKPWVFPHCSNEACDAEHDNWYTPEQATEVWNRRADGALAAVQGERELIVKTLTAVGNDLLDIMQTHELHPMVEMRLDSQHKHVVYLRNVVRYRLKHTLAERPAPVVVDPGAAGGNDATGH